ncbi:MAG: amino acid adenylation domain-containing protein, partial [bacterium]|nr:amino acid adenylation domain-containing protein [bacterium]
QHPLITDAVVLKKESDTLNQWLCAYISAGENPDPEAPSIIETMEEYLEEMLPVYMVPAQIVTMDVIPRTTTGKVDYEALAAFEAEKESYTPPTTQVEQRIHDLWAALFKLEKISVTGNFFNLGGNSLNGMNLISTIHREFDIRIPLVDIFNNPTIQQQAKLIIGETATGDYSNVEPIEKRDYYPMSSAQKRLYIIHQMDVENTAYNMPQFISFGEMPPVDHLEAAFLKLINRHESLRTSFHMIDNHPVQKVHDHVEFNIKVSAEALDPNPLQSFVRPFELSRVPILQVALAETARGSHILMVDMHHIISDGISMDVLRKDFIALYKGDTLPLLRIQYKDFTQWQRSQTEIENIRNQETFWLTQFEGEIPVLQLPTDYPRPVVQSFEGGSFYWRLSAEDSAGLKAAALETGTTLFMVLLSLTTILMAKLSGQEDIVIGTPIAGRRHADLEKIIGMFVNTLSLRNYPHGEKSTNEFLQEVKERTLDAFENQEYQFDHLVEQLPVARDTGRNPLFDVLFTLHNFNTVPESGNTDAVVEIPGPPSESPVDNYEDRISKFDLTIAAQPSGEELAFVFQYCIKLFKKQTIQRFMGYFKQIVSSIVEAPGIKLSEIEIISPEEKQQLLVEFNDTHRDYPNDKTIHQLFEKQVERAPDHIAIVGPNGGITAGTGYRELNNRSNRLARRLQEKGVKSGTIVAIMVERSLEMLIGIYGILKAGAAYLPVATDYPPERIHYMLADSRAGHLISTRRLAGDLKTKISATFVDVLEHSPDSTSQNLNVSIFSSGLAYVIYTSGSTGKPKGVMIEHHSVVNRLKWMQSAYPIGKGDIILQKTSFAFDVSVWELFWWGWEGAGLCLLNPGAEKDPEALINAISMYQVSTIHFVPSMLKAFLYHLETLSSGSAEGIRRLKSLRQVFASGEALPVDHVERFNRLLHDHSHNCSGSPKLINLYGPTEATVDVSWYNCPSQGEIEKIPIGKPIDNISLYVMDQYLRLQPVMVVGELCIGGVGLARGYLNRPELTAEKFISADSRLYKTGDLVRWLEDGNLEFLGRMDHQVKIRGFRIELGEIENCLLKQGNIKDVVVI